MKIFVDITKLCTILSILKKGWSSFSFLAIEKLKLKGFSEKNDSNSTSK